MASTGYDLDPNTEAARALQADYLRLSNDAARLPGARLDIAYGSHDRHRLDVFSAGADAPVLIFFHGGYWRAGSKDARRFPARAWRDKGVSWVCLNYRLTPDDPLEFAVEDARNATRWLLDNAADLDLNAGQFHVTGNSAGGHLAAMVAADGPDRLPVRSLCAISGLFDLTPLQDTSANAWLSLEPDRAARLSPMNHLPPSGLPIAVGVGGAETAEFKDQSRRYAEACLAAGNPAEAFECPGADHFAVIGQYGQPGSPLFGHLEALLARTA